ncbi:protein shisa-like-1 [Serinus canaria]|uniref:protein shisa-like-1 n=1 Tax=Serinus canaria TaxID=9135 RepID=UPI0011AE3F26|nr:protein shisa-like-1 [Serinus canaria]
MALSSSWWRLDGGGSRRGCGFCLHWSQNCLCLGLAGKMLDGPLLQLLLTVALFPSILGTVLVQNLHLCEGYVGPDGRSHPGFYCPRLTDPPGHRYCCQPSLEALKSCCSQLALEALTGVNLSSLASPGLLRNPLALPFVALYGLLVLLLMAIDLCHFYWTHRSRLSRLLPRAFRVPRGSPRGHPAGSRAPHGAPRVTRPGQGC